MEKTTTKTTEPYVIVRGKNTGVHAGFLHQDERDRMILREARRIWYWSGAASLSGLAVHGSSNPSACKIAAAVPLQELRGLDTMGDYEVIHCTPEGAEKIRSVPEWHA